MGVSLGKRAADVRCYPTGMDVICNVSLFLWPSCGDLRELRISCGEVAGEVTGHFRPASHQKIGEAASLDVFV